MSLDVLAAFSEELDAIAQSVIPTARAYALGSHPGTVGRDSFFITYQVSGQEHQRDFSGGSSIAATRFEVNCVAYYASGSYALGDAVRRKLDNLRGTIGNNNAVFCNAIFVDDEDQIFVPGTENIPRASIYVLDMTVWALEEETPEVG